MFINKPVDEVPATMFLSNCSRSLSFLLIEISNCCLRALISCKSLSRKIPLPVPTGSEAAIKTPLYFLILFVRFWFLYSFMVPIHEHKKFMSSKKKTQTNKWVVYLFDYCEILLLVNSVFQQMSSDFHKVSILFSSNH